MWGRQRITWGLNHRFQWDPGHMAWVSTCRPVFRVPSSWPCMSFVLWSRICTHFAFTNLTNRHSLLNKLSESFHHTSELEQKPYQLFLQPKVSLQTLPPFQFQKTWIVNCLDSKTMCQKWIKWTVLIQWCTCTSFFFGKIGIDAWQIWTHPLDQYLTRIWSWEFAAWKWFHFIRWLPPFYLPRFALLWNREVNENVKAIGEASQSRTSLHDFGSENKTACLYSEQKCQYLLQTK